MRQDRLPRRRRAGGATDQYGIGSGAGAIGGKSSSSNGGNGTGNPGGGSSTTTNSNNTNSNNTTNNNTTTNNTTNNSNVTNNNVTNNTTNNNVTNNTTNNTTNTTNNTTIHKTTVYKTIVKRISSSTIVYRSGGTIVKKIVRVSGSGGHVAKAGSGAAGGPKVNALPNTGSAFLGMSTSESQQLFLLISLVLMAAGAAVRMAGQRRLLS